MALDIEPVGRFGIMLHQAINAKKLTLTDVAAKTGVTYEHIRKLIRQVAFPSEHQVEKLCKLLDLDFDEVWKIVSMDKAQHKFGTKMLATLTKKNPELDTIEKEWPYLDQWMKDALNTMVRNFGREARSRNQAPEIR
jgi:transcriptional regulator with XRE-family HTH domain